MSALGNLCILSGLRSDVDLDQGTLPSPIHSISAGLGLIEVPQNDLTSLGTDSIRSDDDISRHLASK